MKILIADDEPLARSRLISIIADMAQHEVVGEAEDGEQVLKYTDQLKPELVLLDIRMPGMDGLETALHLSTLDNPPAIVFTTAFSEHALQAFDSNAVDYLLKPVRPERLEQAICKAKKINRAQLIELGKDTETEHTRTHISAQISGNIQLVPITDIYFFHAEQKYVTVRHQSGEVIIDESLKILEEEFKHDFIRIHRNALVATRYLSSIEKTANGNWVVKMREIDTILEISRRHMSQVRKQIKQLKT